MLQATQDARPGGVSHADIVVGFEKKDEVLLFTSAWCWVVVVKVLDWVGILLLLRSLVVLEGDNVRVDVMNLWELLCC